MKIQTATAGHVLTNEENYSKTVYLPDDAANWTEIPDSEVPDTSEELTVEAQPTLEEKVTELQQVISELTTILNDKGIAP